MAELLMAEKTKANPKKAKKSADKKFQNDPAKDPGKAAGKAAGKKGIPQVVSVGALDMVNFGPWDTVPEQ